MVLFFNFHFFSYFSYYIKVIDVWILNLILVSLLNFLIISSRFQVRQLWCSPVRNHIFYYKYSFIYTWRRDRLLTPVFLGFLCGSAGKESACNVGYLGLIPGWEDPLEKGKATHSSILAWRIPWAVQSMRSYRVRQD